MEKEIWKDIPGYEGLYQVSSEGRVKSVDREQSHSRYGTQRLKGKELSATIQTGGYAGVGLHKEGKCRTYPVYKVVAMAFLGHIPCGHNIVVDHIDNDKSNNRLSNLQLISNRENLSKDKKPTSGFTGVYEKKTGGYISTIYNKGTIYLGVFDTPEEAHEAYLNKLKEIQHIRKRS